MAYYELPDNRKYTPRPEHKGKPACEPDDMWKQLYEEEVVKRTEATTREMMMKKQLDIMRERLEHAQSKGNDLVVPISKWNDLVDKYDIMKAERNSLRDELGSKANQLADMDLDLTEITETAENNEAEMLSMKDKVKKDKKAVKQAKKAILEKDMLIAERDSLRDLLDLRTIERDKFHQALFKVRRRKLKIVG